MHIAVIGDANLDVSAPLAASPEAGGERRAEIRAVPGGSAATFARQASRSGATVTFFCAVGADLLGDVLVASLEDDGVTVRATRSRRPTGVVLALWGDGERTMLCSRGANEELTLSAADESRLLEADHVHVSGYALLSGGQRVAARRAIERARRQGTTCSVDPPPASLIRSTGRSSFVAELANVDWLFPNLEEGRVLTGRRAPEKIVEALASRHGAGALTMGADGARAWRGGERSEVTGSTILDVDPTGAGDAFAAAFVVSLLEDAELGEATRRASAGAAAFLASRPEAA
ncbi:MAG: carbohydrate kinase family protein [Candidatus Bipolaricaulota bacterium]|nr:MAG: carbohydrate kinase family protein [Candidatus Bipolaricaulota bacterium]